jgi:hypothetical protein
MGNRVVDYINDTLRMGGPVRFANPPPLNSEWPFVPTWKANEKYGKIGGQNHPTVVIDAADNAFYELKSGFNIPKATYPPSTPPDSPAKVDQGYWIPMGYDLRKVEISWQANDPLVNSHGSDFKVYDYSPPYMAGANAPKTSPNAKTYRSWMPYVGHNLPVSFPTLPYVQSNNFNWKLGVNLSVKNDANQHWGRGAPDSSIKDPAVGYSILPNLDWRFPDISRGRIKNVGWLGQVHRGTPWQTLYLKSRVPGNIDNITAVNNGVVTAHNHNVGQYDEVQLTGKCPPEWLLLNFAVNGGVDSAGNIKAGELQGYAEVLNADQFRLWALSDPNAWVPGSDVIPDVNVGDTSDLSAQNIGYWRNWADKSLVSPTLTSGITSDPGTQALGSDKAQSLN